MGCHFCASTKQAFIRGLTSAEILLQVYEIERDLNCKVNNIVLMGIGEPFDNYEAVVRFLKLLHHPDGHHMSYRNMTVSTCGLVDEILKFSLEDIPLNLTISLHRLKRLPPSGRPWPRWSRRQQRPSCPWPPHPPAPPVPPDPWATGGSHREAVSDQSVGA